jgi:hypothetical protein
LEPAGFGDMVLDHASDHDTAMAALGEERGFDLCERRLRCLGHGSHVAVRQLMFSEAADALAPGRTSGGEQDTECDSDFPPTKALPPRHSSDGGLRSPQQVQCPWRGGKKTSERCLCAHPPETER